MIKTAGEVLKKSGLSPLLQKSLNSLGEVIEKRSKEPPEDNNSTRQDEKKFPEINAYYPKDKPYIEHAGNRGAFTRAQEIIAGLQDREAMYPVVLIGPNGSGKTAFMS